MRLQPNSPCYFFDDSMIAGQQRLVRRWLPAKVYPRPVIEADRPCEGRMVALYGSVLPDPAGGFRMYYSNFEPGRPSKVFLATSPDAFRWHKPEIEHAGDAGRRTDNVVLAPDLHLDSPSVVHDPGDADRPWKLLAFHLDNLRAKWGPAWGLYAYRSRDGLAWERMPGPVLRAGDRTSLMATKVDGRFVAYTRHVDMGLHTGGRAVYRSDSSDFTSWTEPELVLAPDLGDEPDVEFYGMSVFERNGWFFGLLEYWDGAADVIETHLVVSRDGISWMRTARAPFIPAACDWNRTWTTCATNGPVVVGEQMVFHFGGRWVSHHFDSAQQYGAIGFASIPVDRFCALEAASGGRVDTVPLEWPGGQLAINADTRESFTSHPMHLSGEIAVELLDAVGQPLPDWSGDRRAVFRGNTHCRCAVNNQIVRWPLDRGLDLLRGKTLRLRFHLRHARLFTFEARM